MKYTQKELILELKQVGDELDKTPSKREMNVHGECSAATYERRFGSWNAAVAEAGLTPNDPPERTNRGELIAELQQVAEELDRTPKSFEMSDIGAYTASTYKERFGSWNAAVEAAGLRSRPKGPWIPRDDLIAEIQRLADELEKTPSTADMDDHGEYSSDVYLNRFESWTEAIRTANLDPNRRFDKIAREELITELQRLDERVEEIPSTVNMNERGDYSAGTYVNRFGSWADALEAAGIESS